MVTLGTSLNLMNKEFLVPNFMTMRAGSQLAFPRDGSCYLVGGLRWKNEVPETDGQKSMAAIFLDHSFALFFETGSLNQAQSSQTQLV